MLSSCCIQIAGLDYQFSSPANVFVEDLTQPSYASFRRPVNAPASAERLDICLTPLEDRRVPGRFRHVITTDLQSQIYRAGPVWLIQRFGTGPAEGMLRWSTVYDSQQETVATAGPARCGAAHTFVLPELGFYPHYQFLLTGFLARRRGALHHCAGAICRGRMFLFPARSGTGKSTLSRLLAASGRFAIAGDDRIVTRQRDHQWLAFGTPWPSTAGFSANLSAPLGGIFFLHQAPDNRVEELAPQDALRRLLPVTDIPWYDEAFTAGVLAHCEKLVTSVPMRAFHFRPDPSAVECLEEALDA
ncbi:MAG: hypothetical protein KBC66_08740 [Kiritimatiellae bacterium]|jgi:hypothetical protein|nr:hypothetical protein [Kiritimatiellia bacterium]HPC19637.1 hypothetical protein [Kiritimatiellia bacterium]